MPRGRSVTIVRFQTTRNELQHMSHTWSKSALALHELGLAASFGGLLGAALATTSVLNFNAGRSSRWSAIASALP